MFGTFSNFYQQFISSFSLIAALLIFILKIIYNFAVNTSISTKNSINNVDNDKIIVDVNSKRFGTGFLTPGPRLDFVKLRQAFSTTLNLHYFYPKCHIRIKTHVFGYVI